MPLTDPCPLHINSFGFLCWRESSTTMRIPPSRQFVVGELIRRFGKPVPRGVLRARQQQATERHIKWHSIAVTLCEIRDYLIVVAGEALRLRNVPSEKGPQVVAVVLEWGDPTELCRRHLLRKKKEETHDPSTAGKKRRHVQKYRMVNLRKKRISDLDWLAPN